MTSNNPPEATPIFYAQHLGLPLKEGGDWNLPRENTNQGGPIVIQELNFIEFAAYDTTPSSNSTAIHPPPVPLFRERENCTFTLTCHPNQTEHTGTTKYTEIKVTPYSFLVLVEEDTLQIIPVSSVSNGKILPEYIITPQNLLLSIIEKIKELSHQGVSSIPLTIHAPDILVFGIQALLEESQLASLDSWIPESPSKAFSELFQRGLQYVQKEFQEHLFSETSDLQQTPHIIIGIEPIRLKSASDPSSPFFFGGAPRHILGIIRRIRQQNTNNQKLTVTLALDAELGDNGWSLEWIEEGRLTMASLKAVISQIAFHELSDLIIHFSSKSPKEALISATQRIIKATAGVTLHFVPEP